MRAYQKAALRAVRHSPGRFWAIFAIVALGAGFFTGLADAAPSMRTTVEQYLDQQQFLDIELRSTLGFSTADVDAVEKADGVAEVEPGYFTDILSQHGETEVTIRVHALPQGQNAMNRPQLVSGRFPQKSGECVLDSFAQQALADQAYQIGDKIQVAEGGDGLSVKTLTVVGFVQSPLYLCTPFGSTTLGSGQLDHFLYVLPSDFDMEAYTALYVQVKDAAALFSFSDAYSQKVKPVEDALTDIGEARAPLRREEVTADAQKQVTDGRAAYETQKANAEKELADAKQKLEDGQAKIATNEKKLQDAQEQVDTGEAQLAQARKEYESGMATYETQKAQADAQLQDAADQLAAGRKQLASAQQKLSIGKEALAAQKQPLEQAQQELTQQEQTLNAEKEKLTQAEQEIAAAEPQVQQARDALAQLESIGQGASEQAQTLREQITAFEDQQAQVKQSREQFDAAQAQLSQARSEFEAQYAAAKPQLDAAQKQLDSGEAELAAQTKKLNAAEQQYKEQKQAAQAQLAAAKEKLDNAAAQIAQNEEKLAQSKEEISSGQQQLAEAKEQLASGQAAYESNQKTANQSLADAKKKLDDSQAQIDAVEQAQWYVLGRDKNIGYNSFTSDADRMAAISTVFPVLFFLVAALVALTTMTRMVEEERVEIGTYKALGFSNRAIAGKYLFYGALASVSGSVAGICIGNLALPSVCWNAYRIMYAAPPIQPSLAPLLCLASGAVSVGITLLATYGACRTTLAESPASLMLPKAPKAGKRILLERIRPLWKRMHFSQKVTARNLFRYKRRLIMTVVGIAGCTSLMLMGFGIRDSVTGLVENQFDDIYQYNMTAQLTDQTISDGARSILDNQSLVKGWMHDELRSADLENEDGQSMSGYVLIPEKIEDLPRFVRLRDRTSHKPVSCGKDSVIVTEKLAKRLGLSVGSTIVVPDSNGKKLRFTVTGITENYVYHYVYIDPALYQRVAGEAPAYNEVCAATAANADQQTLTQDLKAQQGVETVSYTSDIAKNFSTMVDSLNTVIVVIIFCAGMLSFVVLYNLTNINITERLRELATLRVLGFHMGETAGYIYRETTLLTLMGCAAGLVLGVVLHRFVITTVEVDQCMFSRTIGPLSFLWSILLTLAFTAIVDLLMYPNFRRIDMVESLKSVD